MYNFSVFFIFYGYSVFLEKQAQ